MFPIIFKYAPLMYAHYPSAFLFSLQHVLPASFSCKLDNYSNCSAGDSFTLQKINLLNRGLAKRGHLQIFQNTFFLVFSMYAVFELDLFNCAWRIHQIHLFLYAYQEILTVMMKPFLKFSVFTFSCVFGSLYLIKIKLKCVFDLKVTIVSFGDV